MTTRVHHINKRNGVTYVYESTSYWDKGKKQPRNKQVCIGKLDPVSGELILSKRLQKGYIAPVLSTLTPEPAASDVALTRPGITEELFFAHKEFILEIYRSHFHSFPELLQ